MNWNTDTPEGMGNAKRWVSDHLDHLKDGGVWAIPRASTGYRFSKTNKVAHRLHGPGDPSTEAVLAELGWTVEIDNPVNT
jgi:hypothetical protein